MNEVSDSHRMYLNLPHQLQLWSLIYTNLLD